MLCVYVQNIASRLRRNSVSRVSSSAQQGGQWRSMPASPPQPYPGFFLHVLYVVYWKNTLWKEEIMLFSDYNLLLLLLC